MHHFFATCPPGLEDLLVAELKALGLPQARGTRGGVQIETQGLDEAYRICLYSHLTHRLMLRLARFRADDADAIYRAAQKIDWSEHLAADGSLLVDAKLRDTQLGNPHFMALRVKDAVVDQFREATGVRPSVDTRKPDIRLNLFVHKTQAELSLDLTGGGLRQQLDEDAHWRGGLGAAALYLSGWAEQSANSPLIMLGASDSDAVMAAAMMSSAMAPGLGREEIGFERWQGHVPVLWNRLCEEATKARLAPDTPTVQVWEERRDDLQKAQTLCRAAGLQRGVQWCEGSFERQAIPDTPGWLLLPISNAPAHQREAQLKAREALLRRRFAGWSLVQIALGQERGEARLGLRWDRQLTVRRGKSSFELSTYRLGGAGRSVSSGLKSREEVAEPSIGLADEAPEMLINRLRKNLKHLGKWARRNAVDCYRLYDADLPEFAAAIDLYQADDMWAVVQEYAPPAKMDRATTARRIGEILAATATTMELPAERIILKQRRRQKGTAQYEKLDRQQQFHQVSEAGLKLLVNFTDYLDTGLFLDHRNTRLELGKKAAGLHVLNLFAYTGVATLHMVAGGARSSTTVDLSRTYLDWARRNLLLNNLSREQHRFIQADCLEWLVEQAAEAGSKRYGLVFMDPPSFSNSKRMEGVLDVQRDHVMLIQNAVKLLRPSGELYFSNNLRKFKMDLESLADLEIEDISARSLPEDFKRNPRIHQCFLIRNGTK